MNRSMLKRAKRLSVAGYRRGYGGEYGPVDFVAIFPRRDFGDDSPSYAVTEAGEVPLPVSYGLWWSPTNPEVPGGAGTAVVALEGWEADEHVKAMPNKVYVRRVNDSLECPGEGDYPDVFDLFDKPHKVRYDHHAVVFEEPEIYAEVTRPFDELLERTGYLPEFSGALYGLYGGRWYLNLQYAPYQYYPGTDPDGLLYRTISFMESLRREGAEVRLYGARNEGPLNFQESNSPTRPADDADFFLRSLEAFRRGDRESWLYWMNWPAK